MEWNMKFNIMKIFVLILFLFLSLNSDLYAVSLSPELVEKLKKEGKLEEWIKKANLAREKGVWAPNPNPPLKFGKDGSLLTDTLKPIVICVDFNDNERTYDASQFYTLLFSKDFAHPTGSMRDYYLENSYGKLDLVGGVTGWYRMPQLYSYYVNGESGIGIGSYPRNAQKLAEDAVDAADLYVDFSDYDHDGDLWVDALIIVHAGPGAEETGSDDDIWSHKWQMPSVVWKDEVRLHIFNMDPEIQVGGLAKMGVFGHEFGHTLGAIDVYDTDYSSEGLGDWSIMSHGSWNNGGATPAHFDAWHKCRILGFSEANQLTTNQVNVEILQAETSPVSYRLWTSGGDGSEYFLVENRQKTGFDSALPGEGLLIYHVNEGSPNNDAEWCPGDPATPHYKVALEQADGEFELEGCYASPDKGDGEDPFPGPWWIDKRAFDDTTTPGSRDYEGNPTQVVVWNISDSDSAMHANMDVTWSRPCLYLVDTTFDDLFGGNGNGRPESGETVKLYFAISNIWLPLNGTTVTGSVDTAGIIFTDDYSYLGDIGTGGSANNNSDPMEFDVDSLFPGRPTIFTLHVEGDTGSGGTYILDFEIEVWAGNVEILLVDDDSGSATDYQSYYTDALDSLNQIYDIWDIEGKGDPDFSFNDYKYIIWYTGDHKTDLLTQAQVESLMSFLDYGGGLFLTSQDAVEVLSGSSDPWDTLFLNNYLHVGYDGNTDKPLVAGVPGDEVGDTLWIKPWGPLGADNQTSKDILVPDSEADMVLVHANINWTSTGLVAGTKFQDDYFKVVLFGFGFEALSGGVHMGHPLSEPHFVMRRVLDWLKGYTDVFDFEEGYTSVPKSIKLFQNYPNPFNPNTSIQFTVNSGQSPLHITLKIYNIRGQWVRTLVDEDKPGGNYAVLWDGRDEEGKFVSSGIYFYKLTAGSSSEVKKMVLLK
jgi:M6 family metalloprotease-like protein